jgi:DNA mismatch repair protein MutL
VTPKHDDSTSRRIEILREDVSRKIAAGEVIDRPFSVIRELLDNSIDARADSVDVYIEGGGIARISVVDNGRGMSREDLLLCSERHATSKIREERDLHRVRSLGFRGEALASVAACSRLEIVSRQRQEQGAEAAAGEAAHRLRVEGGRRLGLEQWRGNPGTIVTVSELFYNLPVRRKFLKSTSGETGMCRQTFLEKAVAHPQISFRFFTEGKLKSFLPPQDPKQRVAQAFALPLEHLSFLEAEQPKVGLKIVAARPEFNRRDKRLIQIYVNRRRIFEYGLVHAVEHAYGRYMPGGQHPVAFVFLELDPGLVDFNIHPAKREARFRDLPSLHQLINAALREYLGSFDLQGPGLRGTELRGAGIQETGSPARWDAGGKPGEGRFAFPERPLRAGRSSVLPRSSVQPIPGPGVPGSTGEQRRAPAGPVSEPAAGQLAEDRAGEPAGPLYKGQLFKLFLLVEYGSSLYVVDQHAAHERILFEQLKSAQPAAQELLMPIRLEVGANAAGLIPGRAKLFERLGIRVEMSDDGAWEITALPEALVSIEEQTLIEALLLEKGSMDELVDRVFSLAACRLAVKEGTELDAPAATELVRQAFQLENARCPHGRPIWYEVTEQQLMREVGRT